MNEDLDYKCTVFKQSHQVPNHATVVFDVSSFIEDGLALTQPEPDQVVSLVIIHYIRISHDRKAANRQLTTAIDFHQQTGKETALSHWLCAVTRNPIVISRK